MGENKRDIAFNIAIMIIIGHVVLMMGGYVTPAEVPVVHRVLLGLNITDSQSADFQDNLVLQAEGGSLASVTEEDFATTVLDFIGTIPVLGPVLILFLVLYEMIVKAPANIAIIMLRMQFPPIIIIPVALLIYIYFMIALYEHLADLLGRRSGSQ